MIPPQQLFYIVFHDINLAADGLGLPRFEAPDPKVGVDACGDPLKQLLVRVAKP